MLRIVVWIMWIAMAALLLSILTGCRSTRVIERTPPSAVSVISDTVTVPLPVPADLRFSRLSLPDQVKLFEADTAAGAGPLRPFILDEIEVTHEYVTVRGPEHERRFLNVQGAGETLHIRDAQVDSTRVDSLVGFVLGAPETERIVIRERRGLFGWLSFAFVQLPLILLVIAAGAVGVRLLWRRV